LHDRQPAPTICLRTATVAAILPILLRRPRINPAVVSAPPIATLVGETGLMICFSIGKIALDV
jgi:Mg/Co/Ni transporter MgtE